MIVAKFGGSSLADAVQFQKVRDIVFADNRRGVVVPSAPGKRFDGDDKVTDLLYCCHHAQQNGGEFESVFEAIKQRYLDIVHALGLTINLTPYFDEIRQKIIDGASADYCASRGEYLSGLLLANYLGFSFLDAAEVIFFCEDGSPDWEKTNRTLSLRLKEQLPVVLPGFYGSNTKGEICVFSRGGSDITGALAARAIQAEVYENWTDVSGFLMADPRIVSNPHSIAHVTYQEMHALSCAGATVLHQDSVFPVSLAGIPTNIRNTNRPEHAGTMITGTAVNRENFSIFAGIARKRGYSILLVEKEIKQHPGGFAQGVLKAAQHCGLPFQYLSSSTNNVCLMVDTQSYKLRELELKKEILKMEIPFTQTVQQGFACIVLVGYGILHNRKTINRICAALHKESISIAMLSQGCGELSTWVGVEERQMETAICSLYKEFTE